ncbi:ribose-5-phosphate isomerase RpiA [Halobacillus sp. Marseille-Q1614]|uniref:ribose-5-phosphate isomerase RpiA n=1 Tax=Halobacillus sp. Marseille-Q1614 TaxID=2709134 RepID=UPI00157076CF|nr:ribose-5-phosphate isomerase RpiA [Halobacillus sp. Marseille-Q1614]
MAEQSYDKLATAIDRSKKTAGEKAVDYIEDGMTIGLGSGSTVYWMMKKLGNRVKEGLSVRGIPSSIRTENWAKEFGIPLTNFEEVQELDLAIDGADEVDPHFHLLKGAGGSLVREKIVNTASKKVIIIADDTKFVQQLGKTPLPIEVITFGWQAAAKQISGLGGSIQLREACNQPFVSDNGHYILDCKFESIADPKTFHEKLIQIPGIVETGIFIDLADLLILGDDQNVKTFHKPQ